MHASHLRHLLWFAMSEQPRIEGLKHGVVAHRGQRCHVECCSHSRPSAPDVSLAAALPGVAVERGYPGQHAESFPRDLPKLGQLSEQAGDGAWPDSLDAIEKFARHRMM